MEEKRFGRRYLLPFVAGTIVGTTLDVLSDNGFRWTSFVLNVIFMAALVWFINWSIEH